MAYRSLCGSGCIYWVKSFPPLTLNSGPRSKAGQLEHSTLTWNVGMRDGFGGFLDTVYRGSTPKYYPVNSVGNDI